MTKKKDLVDLFEEGRIPRSSEHNRFDIDKYIDESELNPSELTDIDASGDIYDYATREKRLAKIKQVHKRRQKAKASSDDTESS